MTTTATASIKSVDDFDLDTDPTFVEFWASQQFKKGMAAFSQAKHPRMSTKSEPFASGFAYGEALANTDPDDDEGTNWLDEHSAAAVITATTDRLARRIAANAAAQQLIEHSATASMSPLFGHYDSEALLDAMATVSHYGAFDPASGRFTPMIVHTLEEDARRVADANGMTDATGQPTDAGLQWAMQQVVDSLHDKVTAKHVLKRGRVSLQFAINNDPDTFGHALVWEPGCPEIIFMVMSPRSLAASRREHVWALYYTPSVNMVPDKRTGEMLPRSSWYNDKGWAGVCATFPTYDAAADAAEELSRAVRTIREADSAKVISEYGTGSADAEQRTPKVARARISTL